MTENAAESTSTTVRRSRAWILVVLGGFLATAAGVVALVTVVAAALDGTGSAALGWSLLSFALGIVVGGLIASRGFGFLGVRRGIRTALLGAFVGCVGVLSPWVVAAILARVNA